MSLQPIDVGVMQSGPFDVPNSRPGFSWQHQLMQGAQGLAGNRDLALALLANSGYSPQKRSFGEILGTSAMQAQQMGTQRQDDAFKRQYMQAQMAALQAKDPSPASVKEYEYARKNGYKGSFQDWTVAAGQSSRPSAVLEWEHFNALNPTDKRSYLEMKRNPNWKVGEVDQVPTVIQGGPGGSTMTTPLSTLPRTAAAASTVKQSEATGTRIGTAEGDIVGGIQTKGAAATGAMGMINEAREALKGATGSAGGAAVDAGAALFGKATEGAKQISKLKVIQAGLMMSMPRMEGPQSDRDVQLYREAAASLGDSMIPNETKEAALDQIEALQKKYQERAKGLGSGAAGDKPKRRYNPATGKIE
jgi:hypothetical protein